LQYTIGPCWSTSRWWCCGHSSRSSCSVSLT